MNRTQALILNVIDEWVHKEKTPITLKEITDRLTDCKPRTIRASAEVLCKKGYLRRGVSSKNISTYVQIASMR